MDVIDLVSSSPEDEGLSRADAMRGDGLDLAWAAAAGAPAEESDGSRSDDDGEEPPSAVAWPIITPMLGKSPEMPGMSPKSAPLIMAGVKVSFPKHKKPFPQQLSVMALVIRAALEGQNALLESPTGTGKTLALLCGSLSYQQSEFHNRCASQEMHEEKIKPIPIIYASRTHAQLKQVVDVIKNEVASLFCNPKTGGPLQVDYLGARKQVCVLEPPIPEGENLDDICRKLVRNTKKVVREQEERDSQSKSSKQTICEYALSTSPLADLVHSQPMDMEDMFVQGKAMGCCPYFAAREALPQAQLILMPYNYLVNPDESVKTLMRGAIVIVDEAHNFENACRDSMSFESTCDTILLAAGVFGRFHQESIRRFLEDFAHWALNQEVESADDEITEVLINGSTAIKDWGEMCDIERLRQISASRDYMIMEEASSHFQDGEFFPSPLANLADSLLRCLFHMRAERVDDYCVVVACEKLFNGMEKRTLRLSCLRAKYAFAGLKNGPLKARAVVLASGTLSPMEGIESEYHAGFPLKFRGNHIVDIDQRLVALAVTRQSGIQLKGTSDAVDEVSFRLAVGQALVQVLRCIPNGVLVFFSSYSQREKLTTTWEQNCLMYCIEKEVFWEPKGSGDGFVQMLAMYRSAAVLPRGAVLFAVHRAKLSEGIDFVDAQSRGVVSIGIPYAQVDNKVLVAKKDLQDALVKEHKEKRNTGVADFKPLTGKEYYTQDAFRALNQGLGRCLRHRLDYGAIVFLESRFEEYNNRQMLSKWLKDRIKFASFDGSDQTLVIEGNDVNVIDGRDALKKFFERLEGAKS